MLRLASGVIALALVAFSSCTTQQQLACDSCPGGQHCESDHCVDDPPATTTDGGTGLIFCESDMECPADFSCNTDINACVSRHDCDSAADCREGQECRDFDGDGYRDCGFPGCQSDDECADKEAECDPNPSTTTHHKCVDRACVCVSPCGGDCGTGKVCCGTQPGAHCQDTPDPCAGEMCPVGQHSVAPASTVWNVDLCDYGATCGCVDLPLIPLGDIGDPSAIGVDNQGRIYVAAYNRTYGDLMLGMYNPATHQVDDSAWEFADGVPLDSPVTGGLGRRGGISDPGQDVGNYLDLAVSPAGVMHVVYSDRSSKTLKYLRKDEMGVVTRFTLDTQRDTGVYPSIALDPSTGAPRVVYLTRRDDSGGAPVARLKMAAAHSATPGTAADFVFHVLEETDLTRVSCEGGCPSGKQCQDRMDPLLDICVDEATTCSPACSGTSGEFCSASGCLPMVAGSNTRRIPEGPGIWSATTVRPDGKPVTVVYDTFDSSLVAYSTQSGDPPDSDVARFDQVTLAGATDDAGSWPGIAVDASGLVHVVYVDASTHALMHVTLAANLSVSAEEIVDDGSRVNGMASDLHRLAEPAIALRSDGTAVIAYQDGTTGELWQATDMGGGQYTRVPLAGGGTGPSYDGFYGFSTDMVANGANAPIISTYKFNVDVGATSGLVFFNAP